MLGTQRSAAYSEEGFEHSRRQKGVVRQLFERTIQGRLGRHDQARAQLRARTRAEIISATNLKRRGIYQARKREGSD